MTENPDSPISHQPSVIRFPESPSTQVESLKGGETMASATSDDFLSGQGVPVELHGIETELERLWRPGADQAGGAGEQPGPANVTRIVLSNLVVVGRASDAAGLEGVIDTVST